MDIIYKGADVEDIVTIKDSEGNAINISTINNIYILYYNKITGVGIVKFAYITESGYGAINDYDVANGKVLIRILAEDTVNSLTGAFTREYKYKILDAAYPDSDFENINTEDAFILKDSKTKAL